MLIALRLSDVGFLCIGCTARSVGECHSRRDLPEAIVRRLRQPITTCDTQAISACHNSFCHHVSTSELGEPICSCECGPICTSYSICSCDPISTSSICSFTSFTSLMYADGCGCGSRVHERVAHRVQAALCKIHSQKNDFGMNGMTSE